MQWYKSLSFTQKMLVAMIAGAILGIVLGSVDSFKDWIEVYLSFGLFDIIGKLFVNSLKMLVVPLVFCSIAVGVSSLANISLMGRVGLKAIIIYLFGDKVGWFGNLFGDIKIVKSNFGVYFPITSMIIISIVFTLAINFFSRFFK